MFDCCTFSSQVLEKEVGVIGARQSVLKGVGVAKVLLGITKVYYYMLLVWQQSTMIRHTTVLKGWLLSASIKPPPSSPEHPCMMVLRGYRGQSRKFHYGQGLSSLWSKWNFFFFPWKKSNFEDCIARGTLLEQHLYKLNKDPGPCPREGLANPPPPLQ